MLPITPIRHVKKGMIRWITFQFNLLKLNHYTSKLNLNPTTGPKPDTLIIQFIIHLSSNDVLSPNNPIHNNYNLPKVSIPGCSTYSLLSLIDRVINHLFEQVFSSYILQCESLERKTGFEPATSSLEG